MHIIKKINEEFIPKLQILLTLRLLKMSLFLHPNKSEKFSIHHLLTNGFSAVNGCHQNESPHHSNPSADI